MKPASLPASAIADAARELNLQGIGRQFGSVIALRKVDLTVRPGELLTILGPSGSGKTTLLNIIAGFQYPDQGRILLGGQDITGVPPSGRDIGMVFQHYALFPHLTVAKNVAFPLEMRKRPTSEIRKRVADALRLVALETYGDRLPRGLSGGQQQRVALARAVVFQPRLLLLDEPLGALDRKLREQMQLEIKHLQQRLGLTAVFVTHDQEEALMLSDRIAVMNEGEIAQLGTPEEIYGRPANRFVAEFIGESNLFPARQDGMDAAILSDGTRLLCDVSRWPENASVLIRPERPRLLHNGDQRDNQFTATVLETIYLGESVRLRLQTEQGPALLVRWQMRDLGKVPAAGERIRLGFDRNDVQVVGA